LLPARLVLCEDEAKGDPSICGNSTQVRTLGTHSDVRTKKAQKRTDSAQFEVRTALENPDEIQPEMPSKSDNAKRSGPTGPFKVSDRGVWFMGEDEPLFICSRLDATAVTRDNSNAGYGRLLEWTDADGHLHKWAMPMKMTAEMGWY
jgi:hypothetical protein